MNAADVLGAPTPSPSPAPPALTEQERKRRRTQIFCTFCGRYHRLPRAAPERVKETNPIVEVEE